MTRPNLLVLLPDQLRRAATGFSGEDPARTPHMDRLAAESCVLRRAYSNFPVCSPARAMLLSGRYPFSNGVLTNCNNTGAELGVYLKDGERCLTDVLADEGYDVGWIGKWHLDRPQEPFVSPPLGKNGLIWDAYTPPGPARHGIAHWHAYGCSNDHDRQHYWVGDAPQSERVVADRWSPDYEADVAVEFLRDAAKGEQPFALVVAMNPPHPPHDRVPADLLQPWSQHAPEELLLRPNVDPNSTTPRAQEARRVAAAYFAAVEGVDRAIGRILAGLEEAGLAADTLVVLASDHGEMLGSHGLMQKGLWWEESIGVPCAMRFPGRIAPGASDELFGLVDFMPTVLALLGLSDALPAGTEGYDRSRAIHGEATDAPAAQLLFNCNPAVRALLAAQSTLTRGELDALHGTRSGGELFPAAHHGQLGMRGIVTPEATYAIHRTGSRTSTFLFDRAEDPYQLRNLAGVAVERESSLRETLWSLLGTTGDPWLQATSGESGVHHVAVG